ncbi:zinc-binding dehydrogenase [Pontibacillus yanchengensis]|uniref:Sorbitol dehydrogenase n=1 Tax=Pontibacillus yanchengensis Y32 TaxID=1385514 RepID=A0A0A2TA37_9BACI|nr:zinc-binding dehydrogenase [Pontibacillus yanchengensis]KGP72384.1 sorbitol dehydrogenase [Pontibacillus yanchengensis Y32]
MKALVKEKLGYGHLNLRDVEEPVVHEDQVKIEIKYAGICGSDLHTFEGHYQVNVPVILGHEVAGEIVEVGKNVDQLNVGDRVTTETTFYICGECKYCKQGDYNLCNYRKGIGTQKDGGFAKYVIARAESVHTLPDQVKSRSASLTEPLACSYHAVQKASIQKGDVVVVLGPGPIGLLTAQVAMSYGAKVIITGLTQDKKRLDKANELGIDAIVNIEESDVKQVVNDMTNGYGADIIFECSGAVAAANLGLDLVMKKGQYVQVGIFPNPSVEIDFKKIIQKEIQLSGSRSQKPSDWDPSLQMINSNQVNINDLITHQYDISEWDEAYNMLKNGEAIKVVLSPIS